MKMLLMAMVGWVAAATAVHGHVRVFMAAPGTEAAVATTGPTTLYLTAGESAKVLIWIDDTDEVQRLSNYQLMIDWAGTPAAGASGGVAYLDRPSGPGDSVLIDRTRADYAFAYLIGGGHTPVYNETTNIGFGCIGSDNTLTQSGFRVENLTYLSEFEVTSAAGSSGAFTFSFRPEGTSPAGGTSFGGSGGLMPFHVDEMQPLTVVVSACGNGTIDAGEACDDDNNLDGDGCSTTCAIEHGYHCEGEPSVCVATVPASTNTGMVVLCLGLVVGLAVGCHARTHQRPTPAD